MTAQRVLSAEEEEQWQELSQHIEWASRFSLILLFVEDGFLAEIFKQRLQTQLQQQLLILKPRQPDNLTAEIFSALQTPTMPCWLEFHQFRSKQWKNALENFFARFNERRDIIRRDFPQPMIILLPWLYKSLVREIAPDLWSVRSHTDELRAVTAIPSRTESHQINKPIDAFSIEELEDSPEIKEWQRVKDLAISDRELFLVANNAFFPALHSGQWKLAETLAQHLLKLSQRMIETEGENPTTLRDFSLALGKQGEVEGLLGRYEKALTAYSESLQICRDLKQTLGDTPQVLRDLSVSLEKVANCETNSRRYEAALAGYSESLQICRELKQMLGDTPQVLRDLSISLGKVADCETNLGRYEAALTCYGESLQIFRDLKQTLGDTPQVLRDLSVSLEKVADCEADLGRYEAALAGYSESLQIRRDLKQTLGDTPQVLRDLSVSLERVTDCEANLGRYEAALTGYSESLQIRRELQRRLGDTPQVLSDLSVSLEKIADCETNLQHPDKALAAYQECLPILEHLKETQSFDNGYSKRINDIKAKIAALQQPHS